MKKFIMVSLFALVTIISFSQNYEPILLKDSSGNNVILYKKLNTTPIQTTNNEIIQNKISLGTFGGIGANVNAGAALYNYGVYFDAGFGGIEIMNGAGLSNENPNDYIYGQKNSYTSGYSFQNYGLFYDIKDNLFYAGAGIQNIQSITTSGNINNIYPYGIFGTKIKSNVIDIRFEADLGMISSFNVGVGFKF